MTAVTMDSQRECTPDEAQRWTERYREGYRVARGDIQWNQEARIQLVVIPPERPFETGAQYVARHVADAWAIGYTAAWRFALGLSGGAR